jgi:oligopeptidase B
MPVVRTHSVEELMKPAVLFCLASAVFVGFSPDVRAQLDAGVAKPPVARKVPHRTTLHGETLVDDFYWLREKSNQAVLDYLAAENAYTDAVMKPTAEFQDKLYQEMLGRIKQTDLDVPYRLGDYFHYSRTEEGKQYRILARKKGSLDAKEEITLDLNELAKGQRFLSLGAYVISDDNNLLAYSTDATGFREYTLRVKDLGTGELLPDRIDKVGSVSWAADSKTLFYTTEDAAKRSYRLYRHTLGGKEDTLVYEEKDELYRIGANRSRDRAYLFLTSASSTSSEVRVLRCDRPTDEARLILAREPDHRYRVEHRKGLFYIVTNKDAKNYRLVTAPVEKPEPANWKELIPHRKEVLLENVELFANYAVISERANALQTLRVLDLVTGKDRTVELPEKVCTVFGDANPEFDTTTYRFRYQSMVTPLSVFDLDLGTGGRKLRKQTEVKGGYDSAAYVTERIDATAKDGVKIPISLVYRKGLKQDGRNPLLLYGYGSYGATLSATFNASRLSLLDRGVIYATAHIRGGREMGEEWHDQGKMLNKRNTFTDFIAVADCLVAEKYSAHDRMVIEGGSAGGLLIGAVLNLRPDVCKAAVLHVPFVDVINTMLDETLPLTVGEFLEWGNPKVKKEYDYIKTYCPYTNLAAKDYPAMLVRTSLNDSQVMYWEPAKYVAKLRTLKTDRNPLLLKVNMNAGHGGSSGRYDALKETAHTYAFVLTELGITK